jgi:hypothetical protein
VHSDDFTRGSGLQVQGVGSSVDVLPSAALAQQDEAKFTVSSARACVASYAARALAQSQQSSGVRFGKPSILTLPLPPGTGPGFAYRFVVRLSAGPVTSKIYVDLLFHRSGPAEVAFNDFAIGMPFAAADQQRLFSLLATRAEAYAR